MILYLDASALVKEFVEERGADEVIAVVARATMLGTALISRAEVAAALGKAVRMGVVERDEGFANLQAFREEWLDLVRLDITDELVAALTSTPGILDCGATMLCIWRLRLCGKMLWGSASRWRLSTSHCGKLRNKPV